MYEIILNWICFRGMDIFVLLLWICSGESAKVLFPLIAANINSITGETAETEENQIFCDINVIDFSEEVN